MEELPDEKGSDSPTSSILDDTPITQLLSKLLNSIKNDYKLFFNIILIIDLILRRGVKHFWQ